MTGQGQDQREEVWEACSKTFNNSFGFERGLWRQDMGLFAHVPKTRDLGRPIGGLLRLSAKSYVKQNRSFLLDTANGSSEPTFTDAALRTNGGYQPWVLVIF